MGRPLLTRSARRWAVGLLAACATLVLVLGVLVAHQTHADRLDGGIDAPVMTWFDSHPGLALRLTTPGSSTAVALLTALLVIACLLAGRVNGAVLGVASVVLSIGLVERVLKPVFGRTALGFLSYPSGHTTAVFALAGTLGILLLATPHPDTHRWARTTIPAATGVVGCVVAAAVVGARWHYFTDTVAGAAVGVGTVCAVALLLDLPRVRSRLAQPSERSTSESAPASVAPTHHGR